MKPVAQLVLILLLCSQSALADNAGQAAAARSILERWQQDHAEPVNRSLHIVCWTPSDREFPAGYRERMSRMLLHIQDFYGREMERNGFGWKSFNLQQDEQSQVVLHEVHGKYPMARYEKQSGREIRDECLPVLKQAGIDAEQETIAIFCNLATWDAEKLEFVHQSPYYAGGTYRGGTAWQLDSPELDTLNLAKKEPLIRDGEYGRISLGKHNSIFIGGMAHELGHAFGLPHCREQPHEKPLGTALMGAGNRTYGDELRAEGKGTFLTFAHALQLASHPQFCERMETEQQQVTVSLDDITIEAAGKAIKVEGTISGSPPIYGVLAYFDPEGNSNYNAAVSAAVPDANGRFELECSALAPGKRALLRLVPLHANGALSNRGSLSQMQFPYSVSADGTPDLGTIEIKQQLQSLIEALQRNDRTKAEELAAQLQNPRAKEIAAALMEDMSSQPTPAAYQGPEESVPLSDLQPDSEKVGWLRPTRNRVPERSMLLESHGQIFARGLYAHAPARHVYSLDRNWQRLSGKVGLASGHAGSVKFQILGDGRLLWESPVVKADQIHKFDVDVVNVQALELSTSATDDGPGSDWGLWLEPMLSR
ncbi:NPCBM/NEW2 domain-containing protein [Rubinisphaera margarita]|uniref:NPCBM/NEW2 domain-containing protein n=1 Tax=Rubinisphaera margarita TaxID=2909586 RepID=UPI001EE9464B|nr:NPCBM/NEW2 domain-containing protein [Rubinisphaera margarita]MCG6154817.1 NPCBM/NEW2 domain-containing protein [Rubinisphaera margarita]